MKTRFDVLLVEDDREVAQSVAAALELRGHAVMVATRVLDAVEFLRATKFDAVLLDWHLDGECGADVVDTARRQSIAVPPIIVLSGQSHLSLALAGLRVSAMFMLPKPASIVAIEHALHNSVGRHNTSTQDGSFKAAG
jgi:DNA-binding response OmpR family regulator